MQRPHRAAHKMIWLALPAALLVVLAGALLLHRASEVRRVAEPAGIRLSPPASSESGARK